MEQDKAQLILPVNSREWWPPFHEIRSVCSLLENTFHYLRNAERPAEHGKRRRSFEWISGERRHRSSLFLLFRRKLNALILHSPRS